MFKNGHIFPQMKSKSRVCCEGGVSRYHNHNIGHQKFHHLSISTLWCILVKKCCGLPSGSFSTHTQRMHLIWSTISHHPHVAQFPHFQSAAINQHQLYMELSRREDYIASPTAGRHLFTGRRLLRVHRLLLGNSLCWKISTQALLLADICSPAEGYFACIGSSRKNSLICSFSRALSVSFQLILPSSLWRLPIHISHSTPTDGQSPNRIWCS